MRLQVYAAVFAAAFPFAGLQAHASDYEWVFQTSAQAGDNFFPMIQEWAEDVGNRSGGTIQIQIVPQGSIVAHNETLEAVGSGILAGHVTDPSYFSGRDPAFAMLGNLVGAWSSTDQLFDYINTGGGYELFNELENPYGVQFLGASSTGMESFLVTKPINGVADLKGLKLRAPEGLVQNVFAAAGASPVNLPGSEVYTSLEKGVIDAADYTVFSTNHKQGMHDFARFPIYPGFHSMPVMEVSMNKDSYDQLPADMQQMLRDSVAEMATSMATALHAEDQEAVKDAVADGVTIIDWPEEERAAFREIARGQWEAWADQSEMSRKAYDSIMTYLRTTDAML